MRTSRQVWGRKRLTNCHFLLFLECFHYCVLFAYAINPSPPALGKKISTTAALHLFSNPILFHSLTLFTVSQLISAPKREFLEAETSENVARICDINFPERLLTAPHADMLECYCFRLWISACNLSPTHSSLNLNLFLSIFSISKSCQCVVSLSAFGNATCASYALFSVTSFLHFFGQMIAEFH